VGWGDKQKHWGSVFACVEALAADSGEAREKEGAPQGVVECPTIVECELGGTHETRAVEFSREYVAGKYGGSPGGAEGRRIFFDFEPSIVGCVGDWGKSSGLGG
jgi:hypothetical protein